MISARYTYIPSEDNISALLDKVNEFCLKYPEYRLMQVLISGHGVFAILTTDPIGVQYG